jgi:hypothetical protein
MKRFQRLADFSQKEETSVRRLAILWSAIVLCPSTASAQDQETRKHLLHELAGPFIVFRGKVQEELKLSDDQKQKMLEALPEYIEETKTILESLGDQKPEQREKAMQSHRQKAGERFTTSLKVILTVPQLRRLQQLQLQHEGPGALGRPEIRKDLKITQEQLMRFAGVIQDMQKKIEPLIKEAQSGGNPEEIRPKVIKIRKDHEEKIENLMTDAQREKWKAMRGKPVDVLTD